VNYAVIIAHVRPRHPRPHIISSKNRGVTYAMPSGPARGPNLNYVTIQAPETAPWNLDRGKHLISDINVLRTRSQHSNTFQNLQNQQSKSCPPRTRKPPTFFPSLAHSLPSRPSWNYPAWSASLISSLGRSSSPTLWKSFWYSGLFSCGDAPVATGIQV